MDVLVNLVHVVAKDTASPSIHTLTTPNYASCSATDGSTSAAQLLHCVTDIADWMTYRLKLNAEKTQFIWLGSSYYTASVSRLPLSVGGSTVFSDDTVRNLGVTFDAQLTVRNHVDNVVRSCFFSFVRSSITV